MDSARLFLCARCRTQVVLCSGCDRGNWYCGRTCSRQARAASRRQAGQRYQDSHRGRAAHARRMQCWRERAGTRGEQGGGIAQTQDVTHQGCRLGRDAAPLAPCTDKTIGNSPTTAETAPQQLPAPAPQLRCRRCAVVLSGLLRQGFVRHAASRWRHDHFP